jgi:hypothetical protein
VLIAVLTAVAIRRLTSLLAPINERTLRLMHVLKITGAPEPELRTERASGSVR